MLNSAWFLYLYVHQPAYLSKSRIVPFVPALSLELTSGFISSLNVAYNIYFCLIALAVRHSCRPCRQLQSTNIRAVYGNVNTAAFQQEPAELIQTTLKYCGNCEGRTFRVLMVVMMVVYVCTVGNCTDTSCPCRAQTSTANVFHRDTEVLCPCSGSNSSDPSRFAPPFRLFLWVQSVSWWTIGFVTFTCEFQLNWVICKQLKRAANLLCAQVNSVSYPSRDGK